ncbi:MAG: nitroreductase family protein [Clostridiaceae bacterium]
MDFYKVIESRTSIKKFKNTKLDEEKLNRIINSALMSPSWKNATSYKIIMIKDELIRTQIGDAIINKSDDAEDAVKSAPCCAVIIGNPSQSGDIDGKEMYLLDGAIAMEHLILAATAENLGTCWIAAIDEDKIKNLLNIPNEFKVIGLTPIGEIQESKSHYEKKDIRDIVFQDKFGNAYTQEKELALH